MVRDLLTLCKGTIVALSAVLLMLAFPSCNKPLSFPDAAGTDSVSITLPQKKVLLISIQGARGAVMEAAGIPHIKSLLPHSIYSWDAVCDTVSTDQAGWANMFTGVKGGKNGVTGGSYAANDFTAYPSFVSRLKAGKKQLNIVSINDAPSLNDTLLPAGEMNASVVLNGDAAVKDSAVARLKKGNADVLLVTFNDVNAAGKQHGFSETSPAYEAAIRTADGYVGEILAALKGRNSYARENWLIIVTSNHGGNAAGAYGGGSPEERNGFVVYYNAAFTEQQIKMPLVNVPYSGTFPFFYRKNGQDHAAYSDNPLFHFGSDQDFTIEFNIHADTSYQREDNPIITNKNWNSGNNTGWLVYLQDGNIRINYKGQDASRVDIRNGPVVDDDKWHHITITFNRQDNISIYMDGDFYVSGPSIQGDGNVDAGYPLVIGTHGPLDFDYYGLNEGSLNAYIADVRVWNAVLSPQVIKDWSFIPVTPLHPDYASLLANWKMEGGTNGDNTLKDYSASEANLTIQYGLQWNPVNDVLNPSAIDATQFVPHSVDVAVNVIAWMGVRIFPDWKLDGQLWILQ